MEPLIQVENIHKIYNPGENEVRALDGVSLTIHRGELVAIIGHSGSGKSTLLRCATMLETIGGGEIRYLGKRAAWMEDGKPVFPKKQELREIQSCFGLVFQNFNLFPHFSVMKNITDAPIKEEKERRSVCGGESAA